MTSGRLVARLRHRALLQGLDLLGRVGLGGLSPALRPGGGILCLHGLVEEAGPRLPGRFLSVDRFEALVDWLARHAAVIPLDRYFAGERHPERFTVALTFDDGHASLLDLALPRLAAADLPATVFVTTAAADGREFLWPDLVDLAPLVDRRPVEIGGERFVPGLRGEFVSADDGVSLKGRCRRSPWSFVGPVCDALAPRLDATARARFERRWRLLDLPALRRLAADPRVTLGTHGRRHLSLAHLPAGEAEEELVASKRWLESTIDRPVTAVAFPDGSWNEEVLALARSAGYRQLLGVEDAPDRGDLRGRLTADPRASAFAQAWCLAAGRYP